MQDDSDKYQTGASLFLDTGRKEHDVLVVFMTYVSAT